jgi:transcriptional regulator with XRE-family HTH domain
MLDRLGARSYAGTVKDDKEFYEALGRRIEHCRTERHLTQAALGARLQSPITRAAISNIEKGRQRVLAHTLCSLAEILGVEVSDLVPTAKSPPRSVDVVKQALARSLPKKAAERLASEMLGSEAVAKRAKGRAA